MNVHRTARSYWVFCLVFLPLAIYSAFNVSWTQTADIWETTAAVRAAAQDLVNPANPMLALPGDTSPRFTPYTILWAAVMRVSKLDLFTIMGWAGVVNYVLFVIGLAFWLTRQFKEPRLPLFVLITMLVVWRIGYQYAQAYHLGFFLVSLSYVGTFTYGLTFFALGLLKKYLDDGSRSALAGYTLLSILIFVTHPLTSSFEFVTALAMLLTAGNLRRAILLQFVPVTSFGIALLWPYFDYWTVLFKGSTDPWYPAALFAQQVKRMGTLILGVFIVGYFAYRKQHRFVVLATAFCLVIYTLSGAARFLMGMRMLLYGAIFLHIAIALLLLENWPHWWKQISFREPRSLAKLAVVLIIFVPTISYRIGDIKFVATDIAHSAFGTPHTVTTEERFSFLNRRLTSSNIVMAEEDTAWPVPALTGAKVVCQQKGDPLIQSEILQRKTDGNGFFRANHSLTERRELLARYHASHILIDRFWQKRWDSSLLEHIAQLSAPEDSCGTVILYRVLS